MAFISDSTTVKERGGGMGLVGAAMGVGMVLGPGIGGLLAGSSLSTPFFVAAGLSMIALLLVILILPESLPAERRTQSKGVRGPQLRQMWLALKSPMGFLFFLAFLLSFGLANFEGDSDSVNLHPSAGSLQHCLGRLLRFQNRTSRVTAICPE